MLHPLVPCGRCRWVRLQVGRGRGGGGSRSLPAPALQPCARTGQAGWLAVGVRDSRSLITIYDTFTASRTGPPPAQQPCSLTGGWLGFASSCADADGQGGHQLQPWDAQPDVAPGRVGNGGRPGPCVPIFSVGAGGQRWHLARAKHSRSWSQPSSLTSHSTLPAQSWLPAAGPR